MKRRIATLVPVALAALTFTMMGLPGRAVAATASLPERDSDLRPVYATPQDIAEGMRIAKSACASCHGLNGISSTPGVPHIAGQRPAYLYMELLAYQGGARKNAAMVGAVKLIRDDALVKVSAYYAGLEPAPPAAAGGTAKANAAKKSDPVSSGKAAAAGCGGCHGDDGVTKTPGMPNLVGLNPKYLVASLQAYKNGQRKNDMMKALVSGLSEADINNIALYYASQKPQKAGTPSQGDASKGKAAAAKCTGCHGDGGVSTNPATPSLAGQDAQYFADAMRAYKDGSRSEPTMKSPAASVDEKTVKDLAAYFAGQTPQQPQFRKPRTTREVAQLCDRCHGVNGNSTDPRSPALAAQRHDYLVHAMRDYRKGERKSKAMTAMLDGLSDAEIEQLAAHYASQRGRSVIYLILPPK